MSRFNLRKLPRINYCEPEELNKDEYVFCSQCEDYVFDYCFLHGPMLVIPDDEVPNEESVGTPLAVLTLPQEFLYIAPSSIPGAGLGVFACMALPIDVRFGPYKGRRTPGINSKYCWQLSSKSTKVYTIDAVNPSESNWMRYVNCSRHWIEQNLVAYQYKGDIYYRTIRIIPRNTELLVFYGSEYAKELGIDLVNYNTLPTNLLYEKHNKESIDTANNQINNEVEDDSDSEESILEYDIDDNSNETMVDMNIDSDLDVNNNIEKHETDYDGILTILNMHENCFEDKGVQTDLDMSYYLKTNEPIDDDLKEIEPKRKKHKKGKYKCEFCDKHFQEKGVFYQKHLLLHDSNRKNQCDVCKLKFSDKYFKKHLQRTKHGLYKNKNE